MNGIYKYENNINHMIYIGQASDLKERYKKHLKNIKDLSHKEDFYIALRDFGIDNFSYEVLEEFEDEEYNPDLLDILEDYYINEYNSLKPNGYNMVPGGHHGAGIAKRIPVRQYTLEGELVKEYHSIVLASRLLQINLSNIVACCKKKRQQAGGYQWRYASDNLDKIEDIHLKVSQFNIPILQYDIYGNFIKEYNSLQEIIINNVNFSKENICNNLRHKTKSAYNYQWKYKNDHTPIVNIDQTVLQIDKNGNIVKEYYTASEAAKETGISRSNIGSCLTNKRKTAGKYKWIYKRNYI